MIVFFEILLLLCLIMGVSFWRSLRIIEEPASLERRLQLNKTAYRDRQQDIDTQLANQEISAELHQQLSTENARQLLSESAVTDPAGRVGKRWPLFLTIMVFLVLGTVGVYAWLGNFAVVNHWYSLAAQDASDGRDRSMQDMMLMLRTRLQDDPDDGEGWYMLGRSWMSLNQAGLASQAFQRAHDVAPKQPDYLVAYAQTLRMAGADESLPEVDRSLQQALVLKPDHEGALLLTAYRDYEKKEFAASRQIFTQLKEKHVGDAEAQTMLDQAIAKVNAGEHDLASNASGSNPSVNGVGSKPTESGSSEVRQPVPAASSESVKMKVDLPMTLKSKLAPSMRVFVFARAVSGPPMPLAVVTTDVGHLPAEFELSDENAMSPSMRLSQQQMVVLGARISQSGTATPQTGDWEATTEPVDWRKAKQLVLTIDHQR